MEGRRLLGGAPCPPVAESQYCGWYFCQPAYQNDRKTQLLFAHNSKTNEDGYTI